MSTVLIRSRLKIWLVLLLFVVTAVVPATASDGESTADAGASDGATAATPDTNNTADATNTTNTTQEQPQKKKSPLLSAKETMQNWGSYYDPQKVFCGKYDCYKILGFDYDTFDDTHNAAPDRKQITQAYRNKSREWHPDKNKQRESKKVFVNINKAYEVLTDPKLRKEYDLMRYNQELYYDKYGASVLWSYAPKSDTAIVIVLLLLCATLASWYLQKQKWQQVANRLIRAAVEDWGPREGGTPESKKLRDRAIKILDERKQRQADDNNGDNNNNSNSNSASPTKTTTNDVSPSKRKKVKLTASERRTQLEDALRPIITELVEEEMQDFGAGYHKPTWRRDLLLMKLVRFPYYFATGTAWNIKYFVRRLQKKGLNDEEREVLTIRAVGDIAWHGASEEERQDWKTRDLWVAGNMVDWEEEQEIKFLSASEQKRYARMKKKGKKWDWDDKED